MNADQAKAALKSANESLESELRRDAERSEGSSAQERRREEHIDHLRKNVYIRERELVQLLEEALRTAQYDLESELRRNAERSDGSEAQERRREDHIDHLREKVASWEKEINKLKK